jgi:hypothetical protein
MPLPLVPLVLALVRPSGRSPRRMPLNRQRRQPINLSKFNNPNNPNNPREAPLWQSHPEAA